MVEFMTPDYILILWVYWRTKSPDALIRIRGKEPKMSGNTVFQLWCVPQLGCISWQAKISFVWLGWRCGG